MSLGSPDKDRILLQEGVKSKTRNGSDPEKAGETNLDGRSASFVDICFLEYGLFCS